MAARTDRFRGGGREALEASRPDQGASGADRTGQESRVSRQETGRHETRRVRQEFIRCERRTGAAFALVVGGACAAHAVESLRRSLRTWFTFYDGFTPEFSWWVRKPHEAADKALDEYSKYLREEIAGQHGKDDDPLVGDPVGEQGLNRLLAAAMIAYSPKEIVAIGERELAWCESEMRKAARRDGLWR